MRRRLGALLMVLGAVAVGASSRPGAGSAATPPPPGTVVATFAGGCFWSTEAAFEHMPGVVSAISGFAGGQVANPSYDRVVRGGTGHLEAVLVRYDPRRISYAQLVRRFLRTIDPTDQDGQFCDQGEQYRTAIFVASEAERRAAEAALAEAGRQLRARIATRLLPSGRFFPAEAYHQDFAARNPLRYDAYRRGCGRDARLRQVWSRAG